MSVAEIMSTDEAKEIMQDICLREIAFWACVNKIANAVCKCEFRTYFNHKEQREMEYYRWNIEPNKNQNAAVFRTKLISQLYSKNEALVVDVNGELFVADSFQKEIYAFKEYRFNSIEIDGYTLSDHWTQSYVLYFQLNSEDMKKLMNGLYESYKSLIAYAQKAYKKSRGNRGILNISAQAQADTNFSDTFQKLMSEHFKKFFQSENAVLPLFEGYDYDDLSNNKTYTTESTRDIKALADDIFDFTARAFSFPPALAKGDVQDTEKAIDEMLTFVVDPLIQLLETEINRKRNGYSGWKNGNFLKIDTTAVKHIDLFDIAVAVDKLISSGGFTINDIKRALGEEEINEPWANEHFMTKNYARIQDLLSGLDTNNVGRSEKANEET